LWNSSGCLPQIWEEINDLLSQMHRRNGRVRA
jgi:hypothetical protein